MESAGARVCREDGGGVTTINIRSTSPCQPPRRTSRGGPGGRGRNLRWTRPLPPRCDATEFPVYIVQIGCTPREGASISRTFWSPGPNTTRGSRWRRLPAGGRKKVCTFSETRPRQKVRHEPCDLRAGAQHAWLRCWKSIAAQAFTLFLLDRRCALGSDGATPSISDVIGDCRHFG